MMIAVLLGCASDPPPKPAASYTVKAGDTLYSIAWRNGVDYRELARINRIGKDFAIRPGQVLNLKVAAKPINPVGNAKSRVEPPIAAVKWGWPTKNANVTQTNRPNGGRGLTIGGSLGEMVQAAGAGRVVYTGSGMLGYGQLVIVKHNDNYLSAYGHTQTIRVRENDIVKAGEAIATMGAGPTGTAMLYFEIRLNGRPVDAMALLPKR
jgi:lipoprotein NlpD